VPRPLRLRQVADDSNHIHDGNDKSSRFFNREMQRFLSGDEAAEPSIAMADYYAILVKAVSSLDPNTGMARQQLYQRARSAMISELENVYPPFRRSEITTAEIALESAIEKAEAEAVRRRSTRTATTSKGLQSRFPPHQQMKTTTAWAGAIVSQSSTLTGHRRDAERRRCPA
jgi:hypothetical protein